MAVTPNLNLPLLDSEEKVSEDHLKINQFVEALDTRLGEVLATIEGLAEVDHAHEMAKVNGLAEALELLARIDHSHKLHELADVDVEDAPDGKILQKIAGKWGLGDRGYSVPEINNIVAELASDDHKHPIADVDGLADKLAKFADATKNAKFNQALSVGGDVYLNNKAIISNDSDGEFADRSGENIDHVYHNDSENSWHFVSDDSYRAAGNSILRAGKVDLFRDDITTNGTNHMVRVRNHSAGQEDLTGNRSHNGVYVENYPRAPRNGSTEDGKRMYSVAGRFYAYNYSEEGFLYELSGGLSVGSHRGKTDLRYLLGHQGIATTSATSEGNIEYVWAGRSKTVLDGSHVQTAVGHEAIVNPNHANASVDTAVGVSIRMDHDAGTVTKNPVALYMNYDGAWDGRERIGIQQWDVASNYLTGKTHIDGHEVVHEGNIEGKLEITGLSNGPLKITVKSSGTWTKHPDSKKAVVFLTTTGKSSSSGGRVSGYSGGTAVKIFDLRDGPSTGQVAIGSSYTSTSTFKYNGHTLSMKGTNTASGHDAVFATSAGQGSDGNGGDATPPASFWGTGSMGAARSGGVVIWEY
ncbi:hypothetical protein [Pseudovibrio brasiliensis]|uniref:Uncharacterized protein n=1 Tax=Pseudovibrio brasiliensis TaxID=1898042 RepID=A0ABX8AVY9_9HYPH|nr:hypothetical protein [Pseudovibrio brasiliensis]QUS59219.1 hypothetical protein KGB56_26920 [Pseudovibrio brasiliensis]